MARFDRHQGTQALPGVRRPPVVADTAVGQATQSFGAQVQRSSAQAGQLADLAFRRQLQIDDFERKKGWLNFEQDFSAKEAEAQQNLEPGAAGYTERMQAQFRTDSQKFIASLPESMRAQAEVDVEVLESRFSERFRKTELSERNRYYKQGVAEGTDELAKQIRSNPNTFEEARTIGRNLIGESGLSPIEKQAALQGWDRLASLAWFETLPASERAQLTAGTVVDAKSLIRAKEGFRTTAYADTGGKDGKQFSGWRTGYGSDTVTRADGTVERVTKDTVVTRADAERDLDRRLEEFQASAIKSVGVVAWEQLQPRVRAALTSITYNYGGLPKRLHAAVRSGDNEQIAVAIEGLKGDNGGVNSGRRQEEANIVRGIASIPNASPEVQERLDKLSYEDTVRLSDQAQSDLAGVASDRQDAFRLQIATEPLAVSQQQIIDDPILDDGQKATLINSLNAALKSDADKRGAVDWVNTQGKGNPLDAEDRKNAASIYEQAVEAEQNPRAVAEAITASKGVIPKQYANDVRNGLRSSDPAEVTQAYQRLETLYRIDEQAIRGAENGNDLEKAVSRWRAYRDTVGLSAEEAGQRLAELNSPEARAAQKELLESEPVQDYLKQVTPDTIESLFDEWGLMNKPSLGATPKGAGMAVAEFRQLFRESIAETGGDIEAAEALAAERMGRVWGTSDFSIHGDRTMLKYPVEKVYPPIGEEDPYKYVRDEAEKILAEEGAEYTEYYLLGNSQYTAQDIRANRPPRMTLAYKDKDGVLQTVNFAFWADVSAAQTEEQARRDQAEQEAIEEHNRLREERLSQPSRAEQKQGAVQAVPSQELLQSGVDLMIEDYGELGKTVDETLDMILESFPSGQRGGDPRSRRSKRNAQ